MGIVWSYIRKAGQRGHKLPNSTQSCSEWASIVHNITQAGQGGHKLSNNTHSWSEWALIVQNRRKCSQGGHGLHNNTHSWSQCESIVRIYTSRAGQKVHKLLIGHACPYIAELSNWA